MFGYLTACQDELRVREQTAYRAIYCGVCHTLRERYGLISTAALSYDVVFLAALGMAISPEEPAVRQRRCMMHPMKRRPAMALESPSRYAAAMQVLLGAGKLEDDRSDETGLRRTAAAAGLTLLGAARRRAAADYPEQAEDIARELAALTEAEKGPFVSLDAYTHHSGRLLGCLAAPLAGEGDAASRRVLYELGYQLGRWVYLIDAADDCSMDLEKNRFNPLVSAGLAADGQPDTARVAQLLDDASAAVRAALALLPVRRHLGILENVAGDGMLNQQRLVLLRTTQAKAP